MINILICGEEKHRLTLPNDLKMIVKTHKGRLVP